jgi:hypothetical protein
MRTLVAVIVVAWGVVACGGSGGKPPMQPDNEPAPSADGGADPATPH